jgi:uncharacterized protein (DUF697 family)
MHNLSNEYFQNEFENNVANENGYELSPEFEANSNYNSESSYELSPEFEFEFTQNEMNEASLAQELQEITNEFEFMNWLKKAAGKAVGAAVNLINSPAGQKAAGSLLNIAQKTLPSFGARLGGWLGGNAGATARNYGQQLGRRLGSQISQQAAERAPAFMKFVFDALRNLAGEMEIKGQNAPVKPSIVKAARKYYPIILRVKGTLHARPVTGEMNNEFEYNNEFETNHEFEYSNEFETHNEMSSGNEEIMSNEGSFNEITEMELASELLSLQSEAELDQFLGKLFKKAAGAVSNFARSNAGRALGGLLKNIAKKALPIAGSALGSFLAPGIGTALGAKLGAAASNLFEMELEGLSAEDREFEVSRAFVRFAGNAARRASRMGNIAPANAARNAVIHAARRYAPGLLIQNNNHHQNNHGMEDGTWYRDGNRIILEGA